MAWNEYPHRHSWRHNSWRGMNICTIIPGVEAVPFLERTEYCAIFSGMEWISAPSFMAWSDLCDIIHDMEWSLHHHSWHGVISATSFMTWSDLCTIIPGMEWSLRHHSWDGVNLCTTMHDVEWISVPGFLSQWNLYAGFCETKIFLKYSYTTFVRIHDTECSLLWVSWGRRCKIHSWKPPFNTPRSGEFFFQF